MSGTTSLNINGTNLGKINLRSPRIASRAFGTTNPGQLMTAVPRVKFEFYVQFILSPDASNMVLPSPGAKLNEYNSQRGITFKLKDVDKPKITLLTEELNQYNKKVMVYKKIDYGEASVKVYDTVDNSILSTWIDYFTYYFADSRVKSGQNGMAPAAAYAQSPVEANMIWDSGWGFQPLVNNQTNFFTTITVYALFANTYTAFSYINPKITGIDWGSYDYASSEPADASISFKYEAINYFAFGQPISNASNLYGVMDNFGFTNDDFTLSVNSNQTASVTALDSAIPRIFGNSTATPNTTAAPVAQSNNISNPNNVTPSAADAASQAAAEAAAALYSTAGIAPGATIPNPISTSSTINQIIDFGSQFV